MKRPPRKRTKPWPRLDAVDWHARGREFAAKYPDHMPTPQEFVDAVGKVYGADLLALNDAERREAGVRLGAGFALAWDSAKRLR